jgi:hypothetical protein
MPCSVAELPIAKEAVALYAAGNTDGALAKLGKLEGGMGGTCSSCLLAHTDAPTKCMCARLPIAVMLRCTAPSNVRKHFLYLTPLLGTATVMLR